MFVFLSSLSLGTLKDAFISFRNESTQKGFFNAIIFLNFISHQMIVLLFFARQKEIVQMFRNFHSMQERENDEILNIYRSKYARLMKGLKLFLAVAVMYVVMLKVFRVDYFLLFVPAIYDVMAEGTFYSFFMMVNFVQLSCSVLIYVFGDGLYILCMMKIEAYLDVLCNLLRHCTDDDDLKNNEKNLIACVEYHCLIIR